MAATKSDIVGERVKCLLQAENLRDVLDEVAISVKNLKELGIFKDDISVSVRKSRTHVKGGKKSYVDVVFVVKEKRKFSASIAAHAGNQSGDASLSFGLKNLLGRAEQLKLTTSTQFPHWGQLLQVEFTKPFIADLRKKFFLSLGRTTSDHPFSGFQQKTAAVSCNFIFPTFLGEHQLGWSGDWREVCGFFPNIPFDVREQGGHTLKSSLKHVLMADTRDSTWNPHSGHVTRMTQEVAGLGGNVSFGKMELQTEVYQKIFSEIVASFSLWGGVMRPLNSSSSICDRFFLGGPTTVRGFGMWGLGPRKQDFSLGGEAYWASGLHLYVPIPILSWATGYRIKFHSFVNAGNIISTDMKNWQELKRLGTDVRLSVGSGLALRIGIAKIEFNYVLPLKAVSMDKLMTGFQIGVGLEML